MASEETPPFQWHFTELSEADLHLNDRGLFLLLIFFSLIILITTLSLYAHWLCRYRHLSNTTTTTETIAPQSLSSGLEPEIINSLPIILVTKNVANGVIIEAECSICLGLFEDEEKVKVLPECKHAYHAECVDKWFSTQSSCPLCRASLRVESIKGTP